MNDITPAQTINWKSVQDKHVGLVRAINEDAIISLPNQHLWAVADGMGGHEAGNIASDVVIKSLQNLKDHQILNEVVTSVWECLLEANHQLLEYADKKLDGRTLGSTVVTLVIREKVGVCLWAGDSRLYCYRNSQLVQLSRDHSYVSERVKQGLITDEEARNHPNSNVITRAIGGDVDLPVEIIKFDAQLGDIFLLCSDGLYNMVSNDEIIYTLENNPIDKAVGALIQKALDNGADDNVSVILVQGEPGESSS